MDKKSVIKKAKNKIIKKVIISALIWIAAHLVFILPILIMVFLLFSYTTIIDEDESTAYTDINVYEDVSGWYDKNKQGNSIYFVKG